MINNEILSFVKDRVAQGSTKEQISDMLVTHGGWDQADVDEAFDGIEISSKSMSSAMNALSQTNTPVASTPAVSKPLISEEKQVNPLPTLQSFSSVSPISVPNVAVVNAEIKPQTPVVSALAQALEKARVEAALEKGPDITIPTPATTPIIHSMVNIQPTNPQHSLSVTPHSAVDLTALASLHGPKSLEPTVDEKTMIPNSEISSLRIISNENAGITPKEPEQIQRINSSIFPQQTRNFAQPPKEDGNSLDTLRANFASGTLGQTFVTTKPTDIPPTQTPNVSVVPLPEPLINTLHNSFSPEKISVENITPHEGLGLSPHIQSGMIPTGTINPIAPPPSFHPSQEIHAPTPIANPSTFIPTTKLPGSLSSMTHVQPINRPRIEVHGRKLLATLTLLIGIVLGATMMHAYLNEYFDPLINWVKGEIPVLAKPQS